MHKYVFRKKLENMSLKFINVLWEGVWSVGLSKQRLIYEIKFNSMYCET